MNFSNTGSSSIWMALTRIAVGVFFIMFAQYKLIHRDFAHGGYTKYVTGYVQESAVPAYKPFLRATLKYPTASGYAVGVAELLIGRGADVRAVSCNGRTPLQETAIHNATAVARLLREKGATE